MVRGHNLNILVLWRHYLVVEIHASSDSSALEPIVCDSSEQDGLSVDICRLLLVNGTVRRSFLQRLRYLLATSSMLDPNSRLMLISGQLFPLIRRSSTRVREVLISARLMRALQEDFPA